MPEDELTRRGFRLGDWEVHPAEGVVSRGDESARLQPKVMDLLAFLANSDGRLVSKEEIFGAVWADAAVEEGVLTQSIHALRKTLGDDPREPRYVETLPRRGYRLIAPVEPLSGGEPAGAAAAKLDGQLPHRRPRSASLLILAAVLVAVAIVAAWKRWHVTRPPDDAAPNLVVLDFKTVAKPELESEIAWVADGLRVQLERQLATAGLELKSRASAMDFLQGGSYADLGRELGLDYALEGELLWDTPRKVNIQLKLIRLRDSHQTWSDAFDRRLDQVLETTEEIAERVRNTLGVELLGSRGLARGEMSSIPEARNAYLRGLSLVAGPYYDRKRFKEAAAAFQRAVDLDPDFAEAWAELSQAHSWLYFNGVRAHGEPAEQALLRALALGRDLRATALAEAYYRYRVEHDHANAIEAFYRASETEDAEMLRGIGYALRRQGKLDDALARLEEAFELDPRDALLAGTLAKTYAARRQHAQAHSWFENALAVDPAQPQLLGDQAMNLLEWRGCSGAEDPCSTREAWETIERGEPALDRPGYLATYFFQLDLYDAAGLEGASREAAWRAALDRLEEFAEAARDPQHRYPLLWRQALLWRRLGEPERQRALLARHLPELERERAENDDYSFLHAYRGILHALAGERSQALEAGERAVRLAAERDRFSSPRQREHLAVIHVLLGENDAAIELLEELLETDYQYAITPVRLRLDPVWDPLRGDPRFDRLLEQ